MAGGRARSASTTRRDCVVRLRLSREELAALTVFSEEAGLTTSEVLRRLVRQASGFGPTFGGLEAGGIAANVTQLRKAGVNLNQITRALNADRNPGYADLKEGVERLGRIVSEQMSMLEGMCVKGRARALSSVKRHA